MGIPYLFSHLRRRYPSCVRDVRSLDRVYDCVYIDFNAVVHDALSKLSNKATAEQVVQHAVDRLDSLVRCTRPRKLLFVSVDGTAPLAKMQQQRNRRFVHELTHHDVCGERREDDDDHETYLDRTHISPDTPFMRHLCRGLEAFSARFSSTCPCVDVVLSTALKPGEGEQKIFRHIADMKKKSAQSSTLLSVLVHGLDADLILMSLLSPHWNAIELYRETTHKACGGGGDCILDVRLLRTQLERNIHVRDFVVICLLLGNDFIPSLTGLRLKTNGLSILLSMYHLLAAGGGHYVSNISPIPPWLSTGGPDVAAGISLNALRSLMSRIAENKHQLAREEDAWYNEQCARTYAQTNNKLKRTNDGTADAYGMLAQHMQGSSSCGEKYPLENPESGIIDFVHHASCDDLWRRRYYNALFLGAAAGSAMRIREAAMAFVAGLAWTLRYLGDQKVCSAGWTYPYDYAPLALDIQHFLSESTPHIIEELDDHFSTLDRTLERFVSCVHKAASTMGLDTADRDQPFLFLILPPRPLASAMDGIMCSDAVTRSDECAFMFPSRYRLRTYLRERTWECHAIIPHVDLEVIGNALVKKACSRQQRPHAALDSRDRNL
eukprot:gene17271-biopygen26183